MLPDQMFVARPDVALAKAYILALLPQFDEMLALVEKDNVLQLSTFSLRRKEERASG
jgi:hypothetical protein